MKKAIIYARVSSLGQEENTSLDSQVKACSDYAEKHGFEVVEVVREVYSGGELYDRPKLSAIRENIRRGKYHALISFDTDRLTRGGIAHLAIIDDECERYGVEMLFCQTELDKTPEGELMRSVKSYADRKEREKIRERTMRGKLTKLNRGEYVNAGNLFGYQFNKEKNRREIVETEAEIIRQIFEKTSRGESLRNVVRFLNENFPPPSVGKRKFADGRIARWNNSTVRRILREPAYNGKTFARRFKRGFKYILGKKRYSVTERPREDWIEIADVTPRIISENLWEIVQIKLSANHGEQTRNAKREFLLRGLVFCGVCAQKCYPETEDSRGVYRCSSRKIKPCGGKRLNAERIESRVWEIISLAVKNPRLIEKQLEKRRKIGGSKRKKAEQKLLTAKENLRQTETAISNLIARAGTANDSLWKEFEKEIEKRQIVRTELEKQIADLSDKLNEDVSRNAQILDKAQILREKVESADFHTKRTILESFNVKVIGNGTNIEVYADWVY